MKKDVFSSVMKIKLFFFITGLNETRGFYYDLWMYGFTGGTNVLKPTNIISKGLLLTSRFMILLSCDSLKWIRGIRRGIA